MVSRLTKMMVAVIKADATSVRGQRNVLDGELEMLKDFDFNENGKLTTTFFAKFTPVVDRASGALAVTVESCVPKKIVIAPQGATHFRV